MKSFTVSRVNFPSADKLQQKIDTKTKPIGSLGKLETIAYQIGCIQQNLVPTLDKPKLFVFAGDHGIALEGVSPFPQEVTFQMVLNFIQGGAAINVFCKQHGIDLSVVDAGVNYSFPSDAPIIDKKISNGTKSFLHQPAMSMEQCLNAISKGAELVKKAHAEGTNCIAFGEMGIGNTSSSAMIMHKICNKPLCECVGKGTGMDANGMQKKLDILTSATNNYRGSNDPMEILAYFGGFETAMVCGAFLAAAECKMTIIVDGFNITAALLCAATMEPAVIDYCIAAHQSDENGHKAMLEHLHLKPLLELGMRLGEGTGSAIAFPLLHSATLFLRQMASFEDAGVSNAE